jgi:hypothetical protein
LFPCDRLSHLLERKFAEGSLLVLQTASPEAPYCGLKRRDFVAVFRRS